MELTRYWGTLRRWLWLIVLFALIAGATTAAASYQQPRVYRQTAVGLVNPTQVLVPNASLDNDTLVTTYVRLVYTAPVKDNLSHFGELTPAQTAGVVIAATREAGTDLIDITVAAGDPQVEFNAARAVIPAFNAALQDVQQGIPGTNPGTQLQALAKISVPDAPPTKPDSPQPQRDGVLGGAAGLVLGISLAFLLEYLDNTVKSDVEVPLKLDLPLLGAMSLRLTSGHRREDVALVTVRDPKDPMAEAYRALRTNLLFSTVGGSLRSIVVTSSIPGEGKTSSAANLAAAMAQAGSRVILVDADFRRPDIDKVFRKRENVGLGNLILRDRPDEELIQATDIPNLRVVCSGPTPPNPSELLGSISMSRVTQRLLEMADVVIFDTPPLAAVTDATVLAAHADGVILVVERGRTPIPHVLRARDTLRAVGANVLGVVLNKMPLGEGYYYYGYYAGGGRKRGKGKGAPPPQIPELRPAPKPRAAAGGGE